MCAIPRSRKSWPTSVGADTTATGLRVSPDAIGTDTGGASAIGGIVGALGTAGTDATATAGAAGAARLMASGMAALATTGVVGAAGGAAAATSGDGAGAAVDGDGAGADAGAPAETGPVAPSPGAIASARSPPSRPPPSFRGLASTPRPA